MTDQLDAPFWLQNKFWPSSSRCKLRIWQARIETFSIERPKHSEIALYLPFLCFMIGPENLHHFINQSDAKPNSITPWSTLFSYFIQFTCFVLVVFTHPLRFALNSDWFSILNRNEIYCSSNNSLFINFYNPLTPKCDLPLLFPISLMCGSPLSHTLWLQE